MLQRSLNEILSRAKKGLSPSRNETLQLLSLQAPASIEQVMAAARQVRTRYFENKLFLYGFIYLSTYCRNHCAFCFYRKTNMKSPRYRKHPKEVVEIACQLADAGVHLVDLTLGEDPLMHDTGDFHMLTDTIRKVKKATDLPVMISPGVVPENILHDFAAAKTDWYALYQETHNSALFKRTRIGQSFSVRNEKRNAARRAGMLVEDGILLGIGETLEDRADAILTMQQNHVNQARAMSLVPQPHTPLQNMASPSNTLECLCIAVMRLAMPDRLIPASLDLEGIKGLKMRLLAGANVVTSIIPPNNRLAGVSQSSLDIEKGLRTVSEVGKVIDALGLEIAGETAYSDWIAKQKAIIPPGAGAVNCIKMN
ncbi:MAG: methylornithine synthase PylB [Deltaproteobacteria bacterium]|nr:methylornithine synthase PylB [Deltaproteobacteria bacterium]